MRSLSKTYWHEVRSKFGRLPVWLPGTRLDIGDVGTLGRGGWTRITTLDDLGIDCHSRQTGRPTTITYSSGTGADMQFRLAGEATPLPGVVDGNAGVHVKFSRRYAFFLVAEDVEVSQIESIALIEKQMLALDQKGKWQRDWIVVTEVSVGGPVITAIAGNSDGEATFDLGASVPAGTCALSDAGLDLKLGHTKNVHASFVTHEPATVLWRGRYLRRGRVRERGADSPVGPADLVASVKELEYLDELPAWSEQ